jgi:hypothetical protein
MAPIYIVGLGVAVSATLVVLNVICWLAAMIVPNFGLSHGWITLFTTAPADSLRALIEGVIWGIVFGWVIALVFGLIYNRMTSD